VILFVMLAVVAILFVAFVMTVESLVTPVVRGDAVGCIPLVSSAGKLSRFTIRRWAIVEFILSIFAVFVVIAHPPLGDALP
jgi:hypothetical protein